ncbi:hypothetical protein BCT76_17965 [Vibrio tasmaniensis]|uniref:ATP-grasp domain-containing protein n=1 Tax=Vibrio tasmaniensis TaxID=212663 RepID=UPI000C8585B1|nr:hypothetical protein [Vibrio tasmaniensis]PML45365.1 hypothetical protein BCT76_17965 [Vibrio tasmaniensis]
MLFVLGSANIPKYDLDKIKNRCDVTFILGEVGLNCHSDLLESKHINYISTVSSPHPITGADCYDTKFVCDAIVSSGYELATVRLYTDEERLLCQVAEIRDSLQIAGDSLSKALTFKDKVKMKALLLKHDNIGSTTVEFSKHDFPSYEEIIDKLGCKVFVIKPSDLGGSFGFHKLESESDYQTAKSRLQCIDLINTLIAEEFITGDLFHYDAVIGNGKVLFDTISEYAYPNSEYLNGHINCSINLSPNGDEYSLLSGFCKRILQAFKPSSGAVHLEFFFDRELNSMSFLEIANRPAGAHIPKLYECVYGFSLHTLALLSASDCPLTDDDFIGNSSYYLNGYIPLVDGVFKGFNFPKLNGSLHVQPLLDNPNMTASKYVGEYSAYFEVESASESELLQDFQQLKLHSKSLLALD